MAEEIKSTAVTEAAQTTETETETFIEEVEVKRTRKGPVSSNTTQSASNSSASKKGEPYRVTVPLLNIREKASLVAEILGTLQEGDVVEIVAKTPKGFGRLADDEGYVKLDFVEKVEAQEAK